MELFQAIMELLGSLSMMFVGISMCVWGPMLLRAIHRVEKHQVEQWERHYNFEVKKANAVLERMGLEIAPAERKDVN